MQNIELFKKNIYLFVCVLFCCLGCLVAYCLGRSAADSTDPLKEAGMPITLIAIIVLTLSVGNTISFFLRLPALGRRARSDASILHNIRRKHLTIYMMYVLSGLMLIALVWIMEENNRFDPILAPYDSGIYLLVVVCMGFTYGKYKLHREHAHLLKKINGNTET